MSEVGLKSLSIEQKTAFVLLLVFACLAVVLSFLQIHNYIYNPLVVKPSDSKSQITSLYDEKTRLQQIDTDRDGLNDYEEIEFYGTSAYLPDSDSDQIDDKTEITQGTDPLCPEGNACTAVESPESQAEFEPGFGEQVVTPLDLLEDAVDNTTIPDLPTEPVDEEEILQNPQAIRELLLQTGSVSKEQLDLIDDATLLKMVQDLLKSQKATNP